MVKYANGNIYPNKFNGCLKKGYRVIGWSFMKLLSPLKYSYFGISLIFRGINRIFLSKETDIEKLLWFSLFNVILRLQVRPQEER